MFEYDYIGFGSTEDRNTGLVMESREPAEYRYGRVMRVYCGSRTTSVGILVRSLVFRMVMVPCLLWY